MPDKLLREIDRASKKEGVTRAEFIRSGCRNRLSDDDVQYWENDNGDFGLHFPRGIDAKDFLNAMEEYEKNEQGSKAKKRK